MIVFPLLSRGHTFSGHQRSPALESRAIRRDPFRVTVVETCNSDRPRRLHAACSTRALHFQPDSIRIGSLSNPMTKSHHRQGSKLEVITHKRRRSHGIGCLFSALPRLEASSRQSPDSAMRTVECKSAAITDAKYLEDTDIALFPRGFINWGKSRNRDPVARCSNPPFC